MNNADTPESGDDFFDISEAYDGEKNRNPRYGKKPVANLTIRSYRQPILTAGEEADLLRAAKRGDHAAQDKLAISFDRLVKKIARRYSGPSRDDLIAAGHYGLAEAIAHFNLQRNTRFSTYAVYWIKKRISELVQKWRREGQAGETRADREAYFNRAATAEQIAEKVGCTVLEAEAAIYRANIIHDRYDTAESAYDTEGKYTGPRVDDLHPIGRYGCFSRFQLSPHLRFHEAYFGR